MFKQDFASSEVLLKKNSQMNSTSDILNISGIIELGVITSLKESIKYTVISLHRLKMKLVVQNTITINIPTQQKENRKKEGE